MLQNKEVHVGGDTYLLTQFPATAGIRYQKKLAKVLLPAFAEFVKSQGAAGASPMGVAIEKIAENIDQIDEDLIKEMIVKGASKGSMSINFDFEFAGKYDKLLDLLKEIIEYNFSSLFTKLASAEI